MDISLELINIMKSMIINDSNINYMNISIYKGSTKMFNVTIRPQYIFKRKYIIFALVPEILNDPYTEIISQDSIDRFKDEVLDSLFSIEPDDLSSKYSYKIEHIEDILSNKEITFINNILYRTGFMFYKESIVDYVIDNYDKDMTEYAIDKIYTFFTKYNIKSIKCKIIHSDNNVPVISNYNLFTIDKVNLNNKDYIQMIFISFDYSNSILSSSDNSKDNIVKILKGIFDKLNLSLDDNENYRFIISCTKFSQEEKI